VPSFIKPILIIDKSFANRKSGLLPKLANHYTLSVPSAFYYEIFTTAPKNRVRELNAFPQFQRIHISSILREEKLSGNPVQLIMGGKMRFNPVVAHESWRLSSDEAMVIENYKEAIIKPILDFWKNVLECRRIPGFSKDEIDATRASDDDFVSLCKKLREEKCIQAFAEEIGWVHASNLNSKWLYYRHFQTLIFQGLVLLRRYRNPGDSFGEERLEHDVHDLEYLTLGLHAQALATAEVSLKLAKASMAWRFRILEPLGNLIKP
jgi:hypothetical protein